MMEHLDKNTLRKIKYM